VQQEHVHAHLFYVSFILYFAIFQPAEEDTYLDLERGRTALKSASTILTINGLEWKSRKAGLKILDSTSPYVKGTWEDNIPEINKL
jgi:hypothetical protein